MLIGCSTTKKSSEELQLGNSYSTIVTCTHKYDKTRVVKYTENNITTFKINNIETFYIKDINNKDVFLNVYEMENYVCTN